MSAIDNAIKEWGKLDKSKGNYDLRMNEIVELVEKYDNNLANGICELFVYGFVKGVRFQKKMQGSVR